ncbi:polyphosphate kinase 2 [Tianweitania sp.]|uniref:polyphosphate kinase 2 n=1 Tax=Tianweitania sp. TaxID=2021634 RepID=UPI00289DF975|nr:polyphosphate kinase 2 [Tianweitania sp.]
MSEKIAPANFPDTAAVTLEIDGTTHLFDIDEPDLPNWIEDNELSAGGFPYDKGMKKDPFEAHFDKLQVELVRLQDWLLKTGKRVMIVFEGRDAAGKGGTIGAFRANLNPRTARNVALPKPTETERGQWYFQRYIQQFPSHGEFVTFDRSWYNRAGVERVMGFCTEEEHQRFLHEAPLLEQMIVNDGIHFFKIWLDIGRETQLKRFHDRRHSILKSWKFSPIDIAGLGRWDAYTRARNEMFEATHTKHAPWLVVRSNDKRRARIEAIRHVLLTIPYTGRDRDAIGEPDKKIVGEGPKLLTP